MELWASGFNAWNQLHFEEVLPEEPQDLSRFTCVFKDERIEILRASLSATVGKLATSLEPNFFIVFLLRFPTSFPFLHRLSSPGRESLQGDHVTIIFDNILNHGTLSLVRAVKQKWEIHCCG